MDDLLSKHLNMHTMTRLSVKGLVMSGRRRQIISGVHPAIVMFPEYEGSEIKKVLKGDPTSINLQCAVRLKT
jgi:hypothetical protein